MSHRNTIYPTDRQLAAAGGDKYLARVMARIVAGPNCCWIWTGATTKGYARMSFEGGELKQVHRVLYEHFVGPIPSGLHVDHLCHNADETCPGGDDCLHRRCVNPAHLEPVTNRENLMRGKTPSMILHRTGACKRGHPESAFYWRKDGTRSGCGLCRKVRRKERELERRGAGDQTHA